MTALNSFIFLYWNVQWNQSLLTQKERRRKKRIYNWEGNTVENQFQKCDVVSSQRQMMRSRKKYPLFGHISTEDTESCAHRTHLNTAIYRMNDIWMLNMNTNRKNHGTQILSSLICWSNQPILSSIHVIWLIFFDILFFNFFFFLRYFLCALSHSIQHSWKGLAKLRSLLMDHFI